jgi:hypothetical protein
MGTIIRRSRKDGSVAFAAQIVIKKNGVIVRREAQTFDRKPAANAWIVKREAELRRPGGPPDAALRAHPRSTSLLHPDAENRRVCAVRNGPAGRDHVVCDGTIWKDRILVRDM